MEAWIALALVLLGVLDWMIYAGRLNVPASNEEYIHPDLLRAAGGNRARAKRLIENARVRYPGKSDRWYREKVIYDLGRDHGVIRAKRNPFNVDAWSTRETRERIFLAGSALWLFNQLVRTIRQFIRKLSCPTSSVWAVLQEG